MQPVMYFAVAISAKKNALLEFFLDESEIQGVGQIEILGRWVKVMGFQSREALIVTTDLAAPAQ